jgi:hypothetical protein
MDLLAIQRFAASGGAGEAICGKPSPLRCGGRGGPILHCSMRSTVADRAQSAKDLKQECCQRFKIVSAGRANLGRCKLKFRAHAPCWHLTD